VYWSVLDNTAWYGDENTPATYSPVQLAVINTSQYQGDLENLITPETGIEISQGDSKADSTVSYLKVLGFVPETGDTIMYGISSSPIESFGTGAQIKAILYDGTEENEAFEYNIQGVPYTAEIGEQLPVSDIKLINAAPDKYLILYSVAKNLDVEEEKKYVINKFACIPLKSSEHDDNWLLQYPCSIGAYVEGGKGTMIYNNQQVTAITTSCEYDSTIEVPLIPADGYKISTVTIINADDLSVIETLTSFETITVNSTSYQGIKLENVSKNLQIKVLFEAIA
jgi:hypothetical protein